MQPALPIGITAIFAVSRRESITNTLAAIITSASSMKAKKNGKFDNRSACVTFSKERPRQNVKIY